MKLLMAAFNRHKGHGAFLGGNFVECATCQFHVHTDPHRDWLWRHWRTGDSYDREPITRTDDERLR